ncbi:MAG: lipoyl synthase [bacterium]|nr:lipoyl synthase [bacterium]
MSKAGIYKKKVVLSGPFNSMSRMLRSRKIHTICVSGRCPNISECFSRKKITFLILGERCTRNCLFCNVKKEKPLLPDEDEIIRMIPVIRELNLKYVILTSVTRDDLADNGVSRYLKAINMIKENFSGIKVEILIPDFRGYPQAVPQIVHSRADVISHNMETVKGLYPLIRGKGDYLFSLSLLKQIKQAGPERPVKSGFMVGLGETKEEITELLQDLHTSRVDIITIGQYFQPSRKNHPVQKYYTDGEFRELEERALRTGFSHVSSGRFVRSSYYAEETFIRA